LKLTKEKEEFLNFILKEVIDAYGLSLSKKELLSDSSNNKVEIKKLFIYLTKEYYYTKIPFTWLSEYLLYNSPNSAYIMHTRLLEEMSVNISLKNTMLKIKKEIDLKLYKKELLEETHVLITKEEYFMLKDIITDLKTLKNEK
jgi:hypothetical protein